MAWAGESAESFLFGGLLGSAEVGVGGGEFRVEGLVRVPGPLCPRHGLLEQRDCLLDPPEGA